jgi:drug/metabolite transporter (DMT)-like permease
LAQFAMHRLAQATGLGDSIRGDVAVAATYSGWRFALTTLVYTFAVIGRGRISAESARGGLCVGAFFSAGILLQIVGLRYVLPSISGILTTLVVVFTPISQAWFLRKRVGAVTWCAVVIALIGTVILSLPNQAAVAQHTLAGEPPFPWFGEMLTIGCALMFTGQILTLDRFASVIDVRHLTLIMFATTAIASLAIGFASGGGAIYSAAVMKTLATDLLWLGATAILVVFSSVIAFHLMNVFQPRVSPAAASVIYCLEPVFATAWSVLLCTESLTVITWSGGAIVLAAVLLVAKFERR